MNLSTPIEKIPRVGPQFQKKLKKLGIKTIKDLLWHFPHRYEDFSNLIPISKVKVGETCCILGKILEIKNSRTWKKRMFLTQAVIEDKSGAIKVVWFNQPYLVRVLKAGQMVCLAGKLTLGEGGIYLSNPAYEKLLLSNLDRSELTHTGRIIPVYPETEGLSSRWLRFIIKPLLIKFRKKIVDFLPEKIIKKYQFLAVKEAIWQIHFPDLLSLAKKAQEKFSFEELFNISLFVLREKIKIAEKSAIPIPLNLNIVKKFVESLPFQLTNAQKKSTWQILKDLEKPRPMNRFLEGDVGSGKTVVATIAALNVVKSGHQVALMAPTEILAKQHFQEVSKFLNPLSLSQKLMQPKELPKKWWAATIALLTGKEDRVISKKLKGQAMGISRKKLLEKIQKGEIDLTIGTQALIQDQVRFGNLVLVILDEQHRFGVEQRARLCQQPEFIPHLLSMTATPIPRTLALTIYGDLDFSLIDELPKGRKKIITEVVAPENRQKAYNFIRKEVKKGRQVFVICPRIESPTTFPENNFSQTKGPKSSGELSWAEVKAVKKEYEKLSKIIFPDLKVAMLHGKMATKEKEKIMKDFKSKKNDILVSTSVIEVGIDVPNATVMMIEGAERFGLAQLHQFRGRIGRSKYQSFCFLFTDSPAKKTHQRLKALISCKDGFKLAEKDLEIRGPGDFFGTRQWGIPDLVMRALANLSLVEKAKEAAKEILEEDPKLKKYPLLQEKLNKFRERVHLE